MIKELHLIKAFIISTISAIQIETYGRNYYLIPLKSKIFNDTNGEVTISNNSWYRHFLTINIPVL